MSQRHYSPDQLVPSQKSDSLGKNKRLREGGSTSKFLQSGSRFCEDQIVVGDYRYKKSNEIGAGYSSHVYKGTGKNKGQYAIKVIDMRKFSSSGLEMLENQIQILKNLNHPNIIKLYYVYKTQTHTYLVTQLCKGGDLLEYMTKKGKLTEEVASKVMGDVIEGVRYLLQMGVVHRDIKPANILRGEKTWKIGDFGFSIQAKEEIRTRQNVGTPLYMPIESLLKNLYSPESDIFAVGVMYYEMLVGVTPWECRSEKELIKKLATLPFNIPEKFKISAGIKFLLNKMCAVDKSGRMQKEEFISLNLKNFTNLAYFNEPQGITSSKRIDEGKRSLQNQSPANKLRRSKSKGKAVSKEKGRTDREYKLGRRKKSNEKVEILGKPSKKSVQKILQKQTLAGSQKTISQKEESTAFGSILPQSELDRFQIINQKILTNQLDYCRFMYYLIQNNRYLPLSEEVMERIVMIIFKHLMKLIKLLTDVRQNNFRLPNWDIFKQSQRCKNLMKTLAQYGEKYEKQYLKYLKEANILVIKEVNQQFSELGTSEPLSLSFYRKVQGLIGPALKDCLQSQHLVQLNDSMRGYMEGVRCLLRYYRWVETSVKNYENYALQKSLGVFVVKNFRTSEISGETFGTLVDEIKKL